MYIAGEGPKRPQHRDHPWSIVLITLCKVNVELSLCLTNEALRREDLATSRRWIVSFTPRLLYPRDPLDRRLSGPHSQSGRRGEEKILDATGTGTPTPRSSSPYPVAIPTALSRLHITLRSTLKVNRRLGGAGHLHLQSRSQARNQGENRWQPKSRLTFNGLHGRYIAQYRILHNHRCQNLKSYI
jgi:hypothetical protein